MKGKSLLSILILCFFCLIGGGSLEVGDVLTIVLVAVVLSIFVFIGTSQQQKKKMEEERQRKIEREKVEERQRKENKRKYFEERDKAFAGMGSPDKTISIEDGKLNSEIDVFESSKEVYILGKMYNWSDIISCTFSDSPRVIKGNITAVSKANNGSVIGRAVVGNVIAGGAGSIIGGTTAKRTTTYNQASDKTVHDYTVIINVNSIAEY